MRPPMMADFARLSRDSRRFDAFDARRDDARAQFRRFADA